jgi:hypothetical protein
LPAVFNRSSPHRDRLGSPSRCDQGRCPSTCPGCGRTQWLARPTAVSPTLAHVASFWSERGEAPLRPFGVTVGQRRVGISLRTRHRPAAPGAVVGGLGFVSLVRTVASLAELTGNCVICVTCVIGPVQKAKTGLCADAFAS